MRQQQPLSPASTLLSRAVDQNETAKSVVEQAAAELFVINAVLKHEIPDDLQTGEMAKALQKTDELESRIQASLEDLAQVNQVLEQELCERAALERELAAAKAALAQSNQGASLAPPQAEAGSVQHRQRAVP
jgi:C4-dicarboxylate-specific signal transduction histidine kinase